MNARARVPGASAASNSVYASPQRREPFERRVESLGVAHAEFVPVFDRVRRIRELSDYRCREANDPRTFTVLVAQLLLEGARDRGDALVCHLPDYAGLSSAIVWQRR